MSEVFQVSLDNLVKGDLERMKKKLTHRNMQNFKRIALFLPYYLLLADSLYACNVWKWFGMALYLCLFGIGMYFAVRIEKYKKKYDIQTFKENCCIY